MTLDLLRDDLSLCEVASQTICASWRTKPALIISYIAKDKNAERTFNFLKIASLCCLIHCLIRDQSERGVFLSVCTLRSCVKTKHCYGQ